MCRDEMSTDLFSSNRMTHGEFSRFQSHETVEREEKRKSQMFSARKNRRMTAEETKDILQPVIRSNQLKEKKEKNNDVFLNDYDDEIVCSDESIFSSFFFFFAAGPDSFILPSNLRCFVFLSLSFPPCLLNHHVDQSVDIDAFFSTA